MAIENTAPHAVVAAPLRRPPALTLYGSSRSVRDDLDLSTDQLARWEAGVQFWPELCGPGSSTAIDCGPEDNFDVDRNLGTVDYQPFLVRYADRCQPRPGMAAQLRDRVVRALDADQHYQLEHEFWSGTIAQDRGLGNAYLTDSDVVDLTSGVSSPLRYALAALQEVLAGAASIGGDWRPGGRGMIHCTVTTASLWFSEFLIRREGGLLLDVFDNIIVPGVGYSGSAPNGSIDASGDTAYAYATGLVDARFSTDAIVTGVDAPEIDPATNELIVRASRVAAAYWDGCVHAGINVDHCSTACAGA